MSNSFNPFHTRSVLRFPPRAQTRLCKLLIIQLLYKVLIFVSTRFGHFWSLLWKNNQGRSPYAEGTTTVTLWINSGKY